MVLLWSIEIKLTMDSEDILIDYINYCDTHITKQPIFEGRIGKTHKTRHSDSFLLNLNAWFFRHHYSSFNLQIW